MKLNLLSSFLKVYSYRLTSSEGHGRSNECYHGSAVSQASRVAERADLDVLFRLHLLVGRCRVLHPELVTGAFVKARAVAVAISAQTRRSVQSYEGGAAAGPLRVATP